MSATRPTRRSAGVDGRVVIATALVAVTAIATLVPGTGLWGRLGVTSFLPNFADARVITAGWECARTGLDVIASNPCDPWARSMNYPRIWTLPSQLDLGQESTGILAVLFLGAFLVALLFLVGRLDAWATLVYGVALFSPSVLTGIERGNNDFLMFGLVAGSVLLVGERPRWAAVGLLAAGVLKIYPAAVLLVLPRRARGAALVGLVLMAGYAIATLGDLGLISAATPRPTYFAFGIAPATAALGTPVAIGCALLGAAMAFVPIGRQRAVPREAFLAGAVLYAVSFALGANWAYRLLMLLLVLPLAIDWTRAGLAIGRVVVIGVLAVLWSIGSAVSPGPIVGVAHALSLALLGLLIILAGRLLLARERQRVTDQR